MKYVLWFAKTVVLLGATCYIGQAVGEKLGIELVDMMAKDGKLTGESEEDEEK